MADDTQPINTAPWGKFLERLYAAGVEIDYIEFPDRQPFLKRKVGDDVLWTTLPKDFDPDHPDKSDPVGCFVFDSICRRLQIDKKKYFKGWYMVL